MTITNQYITTFLSSYKLYKLLKEESFSKERVRPYLFIETRNASESKVVSDYIFKEIEDTLFEKNQLATLVLDFFEKLSSMLHIKNKKIYIKDEYFQEWQEAISRVSPLMIVAYFIYKNGDYNLFDLFEHSVLPSIYNKRLEYILNNHEINDLHIHLNGTTEFDIVWQDLLQSPKSVLPHYEKGFRDSSVKEEYYELGIYNISDFIKEIDKKREYRVDFECNYSLKCEIMFFVENFKKLSNSDSAIKDIEMFYRYILIYNTSYKLLVQQLNQIGFDSFQKITNVEVREHTEKDYKKRFDQIKTLYQHKNIKIEGRFAPKKDMSELVNLLDSVRQVKDSDLNLVAHFIKKKEILSDEIIFYRDKKLRNELKIIGENLLKALSKKEYSELIKGFDAASNELHTKPEVFAPLFKKLKDKGYHEFTFHGGEEFIDLVSGMRYVYEIVEFLGFDSGNRIGHATALGIEPKLWQKRVGRTLFIAQGEYLDNLVFVYMLLSVELNISKINFKITNKINKLCKAIYGQVFTIQDLIDAWKLRKNDPEYFFENLDERSKSEEIFVLYHTNKKVIEKYNKKISFNTKFFKIKELKTLQDSVLEKLNKRNIVIESMITSNKMISFYKSYDEHHIARWLLKSPKPIVTIATDDPGIFATNIKNELAHLYLILKKKMDNEEEVFSAIEKLIINSIIYKFGKNHE